MDLSVLRVDGDRLQKNLMELARFGGEPGGGILRKALSDADLEARKWFKGRMEEAGLRVREDEAGNIIGRLNPREGPADGPCIATGSHIDAVPHGGKFDGALGICASLEALRAIRESGLPLTCPLELLIFTDEEGAHYAGTFGSRAMFNLLVQGEIHKSKGPDQPSMAQDLQRMGKDPEKIGRAVRSPAEFRAFVELHIEQGPVLESLGVPIGIVEGIVCLHRYLIHVHGMAGHAGTTPMNQRDDALVKSARIITAVNRIVSSAGSDIVGTIGELKVFPGAFNIIPGRVEMTLDLRSMGEDLMAAVTGEIAKAVGSVDKARIEPVLTKSSVRMNPGIMEMIELSCRERGGRSHRLGSGAGHDAMTFPTVGVPTGMIFIPCRDGKSHCPEEAIRFEDGVLGAQVLADTILRITQEKAVGV